MSSYCIDVSKLIEIFCEVDDFCQAHQAWLRQRGLPGGASAAGRKASLSTSEVLTILLFYPLSGLKNFQYYYQRLLPALSSYFPHQVSYCRFVELISEHWWLVWLFCRLKAAQGQRSGIYYIDSKQLPVCDNHRIHSHRVFEGIARRGKSSTGWFFGLKLHLVINHQGHVVNFLLTPANVADNNHQVLHYLLDDLQGSCYGDKGYLTTLFEQFYQQGLRVVTKAKKAMKQLLCSVGDAILLRKRGIIESVNDLLMSVCDIDHSRHRKPENAFAHIFASLAAYCFIDKKPSILTDLRLFDIP